LAVKIVHVSDLSGKQAQESDMGKLIVHEHPNYRTPITLEVLPDDIGELPESESYVRVEYIPPGETSGRQITLSVSQFNRLSSSEDMNAVLMRAIAEEHQARGTRAPAPRRRGRRPSGDGKPARRTKVNYATLEHAGEPHRGRITEAEKQIVREHLDEVNQRLSQQGMRRIDPADPDMQKRYGLSETAA
jgi:hypothetical protein